MSFLYSLVVDLIRAVFHAVMGESHEGHMFRDGLMDAKRYYDFGVMYESTGDLLTALQVLMSTADEVATTQKEIFRKYRLVIQTYLKMSELEVFKFQELMERQTELSARIQEHTIEELLEQREKLMGKVRPLQKKIERQNSLASSRKQGNILREYTEEMDELKGKIFHLDEHLGTLQRFDVALERSITDVTEKLTDYEYAISHHMNFLNSMQQAGRDIKHWRTILENHSAEEIERIKEQFAHLEGIFLDHSRSYHSMGAAPAVQASPTAPVPPTPPVPPTQEQATP